MNTVQLSSIGPAEKHVKEFDVIKTNLLLNLGDRKIISFIPTMYSSDVPDLIVDLAGALARGQRKVLLVNADAENPTAFGVESGANGLFTVLTDEANMEACICRTDVNGLSVLPVGEQPIYASELLSGVQFTQVLKSFRDAFDYVFILLPPMDKSIDGIAASSKTDGCVVITFTDTAFNKIIGFVGMLKKGTDLIGTILIKKSSSWKTRLFGNKR